MKKSLKSAQGLFLFRQQKNKKALRLLFKR